MTSESRIPGVWCERDRIREAENYKDQLDKQLGSILDDLEDSSPLEVAKGVARVAANARLLEEGQEPLPKDRELTNLEAVQEIRELYQATLKSEKEDINNIDLSRFINLDTLHKWVEDSVSEEDESQEGQLVQTEDLTTFDNWGIPTTLQEQYLWRAHIEEIGKLRDYTAIDDLEATLRQGSDIHTITILGEPSEGSPYSVIRRNVSLASWRAGVALCYGDGKGNLKVPIIKTKHGQISPKTRILKLTIKQMAEIREAIGE